MPEKKSDRTSFSLIKRVSVLVLIFITALFTACGDVSTDEFLSGNFSSKIRVTPETVYMTTGQTQTFTVTGKPPYKAELFSGSGTIADSGSNTFLYTPGVEAANSMLIFTGGEGSEATVQVYLTQKVQQPTEITGCQLWLKADAITVADGENVATWEDSSGKGKDFVKDGEEGPFFREDCLDGKPCVEFKGDEDRSLSHPFDSALNPSELTIIAVASAADGTERDIYRNCGSAPKGINLTISPGNKWNSYSGTDGDVWVNLYSLESSIEPDTWQVSTVMIDSNATRFFYRNAILQAQLAGHTYEVNTDGAFSLGSYLASVGFNGKIVELILFSRALTTAEHQAINAYLKQKYPSLTLE